MRTTFTTLAIMASTLLVKDVLAAPHVHGHQDFHKRDVFVVVDNIMVTEEITVTEQTDGTFVTGTAVVVGTSTVTGAPSLMSSSSVVVPTTSAIPSPPPPPADPATSSAPVLIEKPTTTAPPPPPPPAPTTMTTMAAPPPPPTQAPPPPPPPTTQAPAPAPAPVSNSGSKRGLAYNEASFLNAFAGSSHVSWAYNWGSGTASIPGKLNYAPMLWGLSGEFTSNWHNAATQAIASGSTHLLSFNEPDLGAQSNINPWAAAAGYKQYMMPFAGKAKLVSPAVTNGGAPMGLGWIKNFISACDGCQIDNVAIHWYNGGGPDQFKQYVAQAYAAGGNRPLHITEFQASGSLDQQSAFLDQVIPFLDNSPMVERYAYFGVFQGNLVNGNGLSSLGNTFAYSG